MDIDGSGGVSFSRTKEAWTKARRNAASTTISSKHFSDSFECVNMNWPQCVEQRKAFGGTEMGRDLFVFNCVCF